MGEFHSYLQKVGIAYLYKNKCFLVAPEVPILIRERIDPLDKHMYIDVCGVGVQYIPYICQEPYDEYKKLILRGIEVKVSRNDFKTGFICSGCNYNYLLIPKGLVKKSEVPKGVGIIEYDKESFSIKYDPIYKFIFKGLKVVRRPRFKEIDDKRLQFIISNMGYWTTQAMVRVIREQLESRKV